MDKISKKSTRRTFLKKISGMIAATTIGVAGWSNISMNNKSRSDLKVFSEGQIGTLKLKNRFIRAAASESAFVNGIPTSDYFKLFKNYASGGAGLIITGGMKVIPSEMNLVHAYDDLYIPELAKIVSTVHSADATCKIFAQVYHNENAGPSGIIWTGSGSVPILTVDQIQDRISKFSEAIRRVRDAGFDGAELNAHYTYFLSSFLSPITNKRTDEYGGSVEKRVRIVKEIVDQARVKVGADFPIIIKVNCDDSLDPNVPSVNGINIDNFHLLAAELEKAGVDAIEVSGGSAIRTGIDTIDEESYFSAYSEKLDIVIPVILTGGNRTLDLLEQIINRDKVDFFGMARPLIREPGLPKRWLEGGSVESECISCNGCFNAAGPIHCIWTVGIKHNNPSELRILPNPAANKITITPTGKSQSETQVSIFSINGRLIQRDKFQNQDRFEMDVSTVQKGIYLLRIQSSEGVEIQKLVLQ
jgi:2,4-dienoyl-CoA reductase-like NADH-dependent reductase (Old Yellow Enzyme family)